MELIDQVRDTIDRHGLLLDGDTLIIGVSGGPDSLVLLHVLQCLAPEYGARLHVGHLDHGIRAESADEGRYVTDLCAMWEIPCTVRRTDVPDMASQHRLSLEEAARQARYGFLGDLARQLGGRTVAVGHHADDQVETVLMHFIRGSGLSGLRGMRPLTQLDELRLGTFSDWEHHGRMPIRLIRPLLDIPRTDIEAYCDQHQLQPLYDRSNLDRTIHRNRIRHELIPLLETYNPNIRATIHRTAEALSGDYEVLRDVLESVWPDVVEDEATQHIVFDLHALRELAPGLQRSVLREAIGRLNRSLRDISWVHVQDALEMLDQEVGAQATLPGGLMLTLGYDQVLVAPAGVGWPREPRPRVGECLPVKLPGRVRLPGSTWELTGQRIPRAELPAWYRHNRDPYRAFLDADVLQDRLVLRPRESGDYLIPLGLDHRQSVRDLMINAKVPRHERDTMPLLVSMGRIAWVVGVRIDARFAVTDTTERVMSLEFAKTDC